MANNLFVSWSDSNTDNPRTIIADDDITLTATFAACDNAALLLQVAALEADTAALNSQIANLQNLLSTANGTITIHEAEILRLQGLLDECMTTDTETRSASITSVYPNPTTGVVYFNAVNSVKVYSQQGVLLQEKTGDSVDLSGYASGVYLLQVGSEWVKVIKK